MMNFENKHSNNVFDKNYTSLTYNNFFRIKVNFANLTINYNFILI